MIDSNISSIMECIVTACDRISNVLRYNLDATIFNYVSTNLSGDKVKQIDLLCHNIFEEELKKSNLIGGIASEECDDVIIFNEKNKYIVVLDPLDGSSNIDINITTGSFFTIYKVNKKITKESFLQKGYSAICAGYSLYGASTSLVIATKNNVEQYQLINNKLELYKQIKCPENGKNNSFSMNSGNYNKWNEFNQSLFNNGISNHNSFRYVGSLVAELHRTLLNGGMFIYPGDDKNQKGKLRLLYECIPAAFILTNAGGMASNGDENILNIEPKSLHEKSPLYIGSYGENSLMKHYFG